MTEMDNYPMLYGPHYPQLRKTSQDLAVSTTTFGQSLKTHLFSAYQHI